MTHFRPASRVWLIGRFYNTPTFWWVLDRYNFGLALFGCGFAVMRHRA